MAASLALPLLVAAAALALSAGSSGGGPAEASAASAGTAVVKRRTLAETVTTSGTIGYAGDSAVLARLSGTVTWLPKVGDVVRRGGKLYELGGEPVLLMYGEVPAYRDLEEGVSDGEDVLQLEENLADLGFEPGTVDTEFTSSTAAAVSAWQEELGLEATGGVELGRVAFLPGARRVTSLEASLGESVGSGGSGGLAGFEPGEEEATTILASYEPGGFELGTAKEAEPHQEEEEEEETKPAEHSPKEEERGEGEGEAEATPEGSAEPASGSGAPEGEEESGGGSEPGSVAILQTTSTRRVVTVALEANDQSLAHRGQRVGVVLPDGSEATGRIERIVASESGGEEVPGEEAEPGVEVTVALTGSKRIPALDGAAVSVVLTLGVRKNVLAVPLTALLAVGAGRYAVVVEEGAQRRRIAVEPGLAADGYVEVKGKGLREGMRVESGE